MDEEVIPILHVADAATAVAWYERLGFVKEWEFRFDPDCPAFVTVTGCGSASGQPDLSGSRPEAAVGKDFGNSPH